MIRPVRPAARLLAAALRMSLAAACADSVGPAANVTGNDPDAGAALALAADAPAEVVGGESVTIRGTGFSSTPSQNVVTLGGVALTVSGATSTSLTVAIPSTAFACAPARSVALVVNARGSSATRPVLLRSARPYALAPGASAVLSATQRCLELTQPGSRYLVGVINAGRVAGSVAPFELGGMTAPPAAASASVSASATAVHAAAPAVTTGGTAGSVRSVAVADAGEVRQATLHHHILETTRGLRARLGRPRAAGNVLAIDPTMGSRDPIGSGPTLSLGPTSALRSVGDTATLRIPDINAGNACGKFFSVQARVVYAGSRAIIVEDVNAPLAGRMDDTYRSIGDEFDRVMWPILTGSFGNPLAMDARLDQNGRILMLFSPVVNQNFTGIAGFVIGCDFYSRSQASASNEAEVFYANVPTSLTGTLSSSTSRDGWRRTMRSTIIHEAKHITAYAERIARDVNLEESWIEEGSARIAEELYARALSGTAWKSNAGYAAISCEVRLSSPGCTGRPYVMFKHFEGLANYLGANGGLSPLGQTSPNDYNYYASAWSLLRWAADVAPSESAFLQALVRGPATGIANLEAVAGRSWDDMLADWSLGLALDDQPSFTAQRPQGIATWNLRDVFAGMNRDFPATYVRANPTVSHPALFGTFTVQGGSVRGGSAALVDVTGTWAGPQVLELRAAGGGTPATTLRLAVTRVQ